MAMKPLGVRDQRASKKIIMQNATFNRNTEMVKLKSAKNWKLEYKVPLVDIDD